MKILVTGSTGFIGGAICRALLEKGHSVRAFHRPASAPRLLEDLPVEHALGDLTQPDSLIAAIQGIEVVFHAAALLGGPGSAGRMYAVTVEGTRTVLNAALDAGVRRVIHTSSVAALGVPELSPHGLPPALLDERHTWNFRPDHYAYGYAKYLAELEVENAVARGLDVVIVNPGYVIGAGDVYRQTSSLVVQVARHRLPASVEGGVNVVHIADVVAGHLAALERGRVGERYILGGTNISIPALIKAIAITVGVEAPLLVVPTALAHLAAAPLHLLEAYLTLPTDAAILHLAGRYFYYDTHKAQSELGLTEVHNVGEAILDAFTWFKSVDAL